MAMASTEKVVLGSIAFVVFWVMAVFPSVPFLPIGRTAGALLGAMLMVIFRVITPDQAYAAIDLPILGLLFGTMVVSVYLDRADMFKYLGKLLSYKSRGPKDLLCRICLVSGVSSALFTNDTSCIVLTEFVLKLADQHNLPPRPLLLALASSANIGSSATPIGNPQNLVIAIQSKISFGSFLIGLLPAMVVGIIINVLILLVMYWRELSVPEGLAEDRPTRDDQATREDRDPSSVLSEEQYEGTEQDEGTAMAEYVEEGRGNEAGLNNNSFSVECPDQKETRIDRWKRMLWKCCVYVITVGMLVALLLGLNMSWTAITAALALVVLDFTDAGSSLNKVSYSLLIFFCGMFITVEGFNRTGIPTALWDLMEPHSKINHPSGIAVLAIVILLLSNLASNVPTVLLMGARVAASAAAISTADEKKSWLILAWVSTVAGNLSLLGSAANLIVCEQARRAPNLGYNLSFWGHLKFGVPSTLIVTAIGLMLIK